jgi:hypothetical protein
MKALGLKTKKICNFFKLQPTIYIVHENLNPQYSDPTGSGAFISTRLNLHFEKNIKCKLQLSYNSIPGSWEFYPKIYSYTT